VNKFVAKLRTGFICLTGGAVLSGSLLAGVPAHANGPGHTSYIKNNSTSNFNMKLCQDWGTSSKCAKTGGTLKPGESSKKKYGKKDMDGFWVPTGECAFNLSNDVVSYGGHYFKVLGSGVALTWTYRLDPCPKRPGRAAFTQASVVEGFAYPVKAA
jgi:hypothetical protein